MGYTTDFVGSFAIDPPLQPEHRIYLGRFSGTRRMRRDAHQAAKRPDAVRKAVGLDVGVEGGYFVGSTADAGQDWDSPDVLGGNTAPSGQPGLWCQWVPSEDGTAIAWNEAEKFYEYVGWLEYLILHFLAPWGYTVSGEISWQGEEPPDRGIIYAKDNRVQAIADTVSVSNKGPSW